VYSAVESCTSHTYIPRDKRPPAYLQARDERCRPQPAHGPCTLHSLRLFEREKGRREGIRASHDPHMTCLLLLAAARNLDGVWRLEIRVCGVCRNLSLRRERGRRESTDLPPGRRRRRNMNTGKTEHGARAVLPIDQSAIEYVTYYGSSPTCGRRSGRVIYMYVCVCALFLFLV